MRNHARGSPNPGTREMKKHNGIDNDGGHHIALGSGVKVIQGNGTEILAGGHHVRGTIWG